MRYLPYLALIGVVTYLLIAWLQRRRGGRGGPAGRGRRPGGSPRGPVAPDDDPAFLAELDRRRREAERRRKADQAKEAPAGSGEEEVDEGRGGQSPL